MMCGSGLEQHLQVALSDKEMEQILARRDKQDQHAPLCLVELPDALNNRAVPLMRAMAHVQASDVHAIDSHNLEHLLGACCRSNCGYDLGTPCASETCKIVMCHNLVLWKMPHILKEAGSKGWIQQIMVLLYIGADLCNRQERASLRRSIGSAKYLS